MNFYTENHTNFVGTVAKGREKGYSTVEVTAHAGKQVNEMRKDGTLVTDGNPMYRVAAYIMKHRYDAMNMIELDIPLEGMQNYLNEKRREGIRMSHLGVVLAAYLRAAYEYPEVNRFVVNKRLYQRNEFTVGMVVLKPGETDGTMNKMFFKFDDDIFAVHKVMEDYVETNRAPGDTNSTDDLIRKFLKFPVLLSAIVGLLKFADKYGLLPKKVIDMSPFHESLVISNLASIRTNHIFHHVYEFGTVSVLLTMGNMRDIARKSGDGVRFERCIPMGIVMDERICSGSYFAAFAARFKQYMANPKLLEKRPEEK